MKNRRASVFSVVQLLASRAFFHLANLRVTSLVPGIVALLPAAILLPGCGRVFEDNGTHLAYALEKAAKELRASDATETVVNYEPLDGLNESYYVEITPSFGESAQTSTVWSSYLVVSGKTSGGTSYHNRFVFVPKRLFIQKVKGATELLLKKDGAKINVIEVR